MEDASAYTAYKLASARFHNPNTLLWTHEYPDSRVVIVFERISSVECVLEKRDRERENMYSSLWIENRSFKLIYRTAKEC